MAGRHLEKNIISPCPHCMGSGIGRQTSCHPFVIKVEHLDLSVPKGCHSDHVFFFKGKGHYSYQTGASDIGDLTFRVRKIQSGNITVVKDVVQVEVTLTPQEVLEVNCISYSLLEPLILNLYILKIGV